MMYPVVFIGFFGVVRFVPDFFALDRGFLTPPFETVLGSWASWASEARPSRSPSSSRPLVPIFPRWASSRAPRASSLGSSAPPSSSYCSFERASSP